MKLKSLIKQLDNRSIKPDRPSLSVGSVVCVDVLIQEGSKKRVQSYTGTLISQHKAGLNSTITVRRVSKGIGIERVFPVHSPDINSIRTVTGAFDRGVKGKATKK